MQMGGRAIKLILEDIKTYPELPSIPAYPDKTK
jgi:hypothetical protein